MGLRKLMSLLKAKDMDEPIPADKTFDKEIHQNEPSPKVDN